MHLDGLRLETETLDNDDVVIFVGKSHMMGLGFFCVKNVLFDHIKFWPIICVILL